MFISLNKKGGGYIATYHILVLLLKSVLHNCNFYKQELSRELYQCKKRLESYESSSGMRAESISLGSRASSSASLHISNSNDVCQSSPSFTYNNKKEVAPGKVSKYFYSFKMLYIL